MIKALIHNSQGASSSTSILQQVDLTGIDLMFLPYCHLENALALRRKYGVNINWKATTDVADNIGLCVMSKEDTTIDLKVANIPVDHNNPYNSNRFMLFDYQGIKMCHAVRQPNALYDAIYLRDIERHMPHLVLGENIGLEDPNVIVMKESYTDNGITYVNFELA